MQLFACSIVYIGNGGGIVLEELIQNYYDRIQYYFIQRVKDRYIAEDLTQEVFLKVVLALPKRQPDHFESWLFTIAKFTLYDH